MPAPASPDALAAALARSIDAEQAEEPNRASSLDPDRIRGTFRQTLLQRLEAAESLVGTVEPDGSVTPDAAARATLGAHASLLDERLHRLDQLMVAHPFTPKSNQLVPPEAKAAGAELFEVFRDVRGRIAKRLGDGPVDRAIKQGCAVNVHVLKEDVLGVRDHAARMILALENPEHAHRFEARMIELPPLLDPLVAAHRRVVDALAVGITLTRAESAGRIRQELVFIDICLERVVAFLKDHGAGEVAGAIVGLTPRRVRGAGRGRAVGERSVARADGEAAGDGRLADARVASSDALRASPESGAPRRQAVSAQLRLVRDVQSDPVEQPRLLERPG